MTKSWQEFVIFSGKDSKFEFGKHILTNPVPRGRIAFSSYAIDMWLNPIYGRPLKPRTISLFSLLSRFWHFYNVVNWRKGKNYLQSFWTKSPVFREKNESIFLSFNGRLRIHGRHLAEWMGWWRDGWVVWCIIMLFFILSIPNSSFQQYAGGRGVNWFMAVCNYSAKNRLWLLLTNCHRTFSKMILLFSLQGSPL